MQNNNIQEYEYEPLPSHIQSQIYFKELVNYATKRGIKRFLIRYFITILIPTIILGIMLLQHNQNALSGDELIAKGLIIILAVYPLFAANASKKKIIAHDKEIQNAANEVFQYLTKTNLNGVLNNKKLNGYAHLTQFTQKYVPPKVPIKMIKGGNGEQVPQSESDVRDIAYFLVKLPSVYGNLREKYSSSLVAYLNTHLNFSSLDSWSILWISNGTEGYVYPIIRSTLPSKLDCTAQDLINFAQKSNSSTVTLGKNEREENAEIDITRSYHMLIAGQTGGGKSNAINILLAQWMQQSNTNIILVDLKSGIELYPWSRGRNVSAFAMDDESAFQVLQEARDEMMRRNDLIRQNGVRDARDLNLPKTLIVIDEIAQLFDAKIKEDKEMSAKRAQAYKCFSEILSLGRVSQTFIVACTQRPDSDVIGVRERNNFPTRISGKLTTKSSSEIILGDGDDTAFTMPRRPGLMALKVGDDTQLIQTYYASDSVVQQIQEITRKDDDYE